MRRRRHNLKSKFSEPLQPTHNTSGTRKHHSHSEGVNNIEIENPDSAPSQTFRPGTRSSSRFVLSLAISDLLVGLSMPFHMVFYIQGADGGGSPLMIGKDYVTLGQIEWACLLRFVLIALACSASACNLLAIAVDRYLAIVYPLHYCRYMTKSAVVLALTILYWRIGKEARAQLKRLLGADGKGPPWKRFQNGKTYSSSTSTASDKDRHRTQHGVNRQANKEINKTNETVSSFKDERCLNGSQDIPKREKEIGSSSNIRKEIDEFKKNSKLPHLQETEEEHYQEEKGKSSNDYLNDSGFDQKKPNLKDEINMLQEKTEKCPTVREVCSIVKCQSDPNLVSYFEDEIVKDKKGIKPQKGLNNQVQYDSELTNKTITARQSHFSPINNFTKGNQQITDNGSQKTQCGFQMNFLKREKWLTKRKSMDQTYKSGTFNTMPKVMMANKMHFDKLPELTISLADFIKETNDIDNNKTNNDNKDRPNKSETSKENPTQKIPTKEVLEEPKQNNLLKDSSEVRSHCHDEPLKFSPEEESQESINITIAADFPTSENTPISEVDEEEGENEGIERRASCMRSISSGCSSRGGHRNSTWNIRFPSLTSGNASIRPNVSKSTIVVLLVLGSFILLWLPYLTVSSLLVKGVKLPYTLYRLTFSLAMSNSGVNPIIYGWKNAELKRVFMRFVMSKWHRCTKRWKQRKEQEPAIEMLNEYAPSIEISHIS
ncbi:hypothetical protein J437_LFUL017283 [Ladona fulva]|uniref:G-protein coupled receptors family 1 profile domain-containing protein n=1 Tax=Ladona fulva TaxID=123851 RepID=A0A8K0P7K6_LADFU|nr:hypothetical protein J437_LFUL017283 [Ladona fulva]